MDGLAACLLKPAIGRLVASPPTPRAETEREAGRKMKQKQNTKAFSFGFCRNASRYASFPVRVLVDVTRDLLIGVRFLFLSTSSTYRNAPRPFDLGALCVWAYLPMFTGAFSAVASMPGMVSIFGGSAPRQSLRT